jgi:hypothetical protein
MLVPRLSIVTSDLHFIAKSVERPGSKEDVFEELDMKAGADIGERYVPILLLSYRPI